MPVPHPRDESDANLPDPELDPLLNPLLAAHMGRWAEVYFANPPEKRGQAISDLLRELNSSSAGTASIPYINDAKGNGEADASGAPDSSPVAEEPVLICRACAYNNSAGHSFCGMCGATLPVSPEGNAPQPPEDVLRARVSWSKHEPSTSGQSAQYALDPAASGRYDSSEPAFALPKNFSKVRIESEPVPYRQRLSMAAALAILLTVLGYIAWHGVAVLSSAPSLGSALSSASAQSAAAASARLPGTAPKDQTASAGTESRMTAPAAVDSSPKPAERGGGAEELATAERYLNGDQGTPRDSSEAAQWLWKAVGKGNLAATMALSDLYLRGDGVTKSCDQARLLLDAASRKGQTAATERLRNLQAFGCE
jgi:hypothetical protein